MTVFNSRSVRAAMEGRPIVRRLRGLQREPFVLHSWPFSSGLELYMLCERFQSSGDRNFCAGESEFHGQVQPWVAVARQAYAERFSRRAPLGGFFRTSPVGFTPPWFRCKEFEELAAQSAFGGTAFPQLALWTASQNCGQAPSECANLRNNFRVPRHPPAIARRRWRTSRTGRHLSGNRVNQALSPVGW